jgi:hypothetical protein
LIENDLDAAIWPGLDYGLINGQGNRMKCEPSKEDVIYYLHSLNDIKLNLAEEYVRNAPKQIDTEYRREFQKFWGWMSKN